MPNTFSELAAAVRRLSQTSVLVELAHDSALTYAGAQWHLDLDRLKQYPWVNPQIARLALVNGTNFQRKAATQHDIIRLKNRYHNLDPESESGDLWSVMNRLLHEQIPLQYPLLNELARAWRLMGQPTQGSAHYDWSDVFGTSLAERIRVLFFLHVWAVQNRGVFGTEVLATPGYLALLNRLGIAGTLQPVIEDLARTPGQIRSLHETRAGTRAVRSLAEFNDLHRFPLVQLGPREFAAPAINLLLASVSTYNLYYRGIETWGKKFADDLGPRVERVAGEDLTLLADVRLVREITYAKGQNRSVDWIAVFPECVLLVECKSARVGLEALRTIQGEEDLVARYLRKAADQIDETARVAGRGLPEFVDIPSDRPFYGLIVAAENIYLGGVGIDRWRIGGSVPTEVISLSDLEELCALEIDHPGAYIDDYFRTRNPGITSLVRSAATEFEVGDNPFFDAAWKTVDFTTEFQHLQED